MACNLKFDPTKMAIDLMIGPEDVLKATAEKLLGEKQICVFVDSNSVLTIDSLPMLFCWPFSRILSDRM